MKAQALLERFIKLHGGSIPKCAINASSENSDISFIWAYYYLAVTDLWRATLDVRALSMLIHATDWVFAQTDKRIGKDHRFDVVTGWNPKTVESRSFSEGYGASPSKKLNSGWSRYIGIGNGVKAFRPEILASGHIGYAIACFIRDAKELHAETGVKSIPSDKFYGWLNELEDIFKYHEPNWRYYHEHSKGVHKELGPISGYFWPSNTDGDVWPTQPAINQQSQFLSMGVVVEGLTGKDIGAKAKLKSYCDNTLEHLMIEDNGRIALRYDLRDHSKMSPYQAEPTSDSVHTQKAMPLFLEAERLGYLSDSIHGGLIRQLKEVTHLGNGEMAVLMDGSSSHGRREDHPSASHLSDSVLLVGGHSLIDLYEQALARDFPEPDNHKAWQLHARLARAKAERTEAESHTNIKNTVDAAQDVSTPPVKAVEKDESQNAEKPKDEGYTRTADVTKTGIGVVFDFSVAGRVVNDGDQPYIFDFTSGKKNMHFVTAGVGSTDIKWIDSEGDKFVTTLTVEKL